MKKYVINKNENITIKIINGGEYVVELAGEGAEVNIMGGWHLKGRQELKVKLNIIHQAPHTTSHTLFKAVVGDKAMADIRGKIIVEKKAQQTEAFLKEVILLVSAGARATAVPDLEIEANDVKASHAATVSKIDEEQIFYLTSKGMSRIDAEELIVRGFLSLE